MSLKSFLIDSNQAQYSAEEFSQLQTLLLNEGVFNTVGSNTDFKVVQRSAGANMSVDIGLGAAVISYLKNGVTWKVIIKNNAVVNKTVTDNSSGSNRVDAVVLHLLQTEPNSLKNNVAEILVVAGSGVSALTDGAVDSAVGDTNWYRLADLTVSNGDTSIITGDIADTRNLLTIGPLAAVETDAINQGQGANGVLINQEVRIFASSYDVAEKASAPATPSSGRWKLYFKAAGLYMVDDAGVESQLGVIGAFYIGGDGSDGALSVPSGTTTINLDQVYNYSSISVSVGAILAFTGTGAAMVNCSGNCTIDGTVEMRGLVTTRFGVFTDQSIEAQCGTTMVTPAPNVGGTGGTGVSTGGTGGTSTTASGSPGVGGTAPNGNGNGGNSSTGGGGGASNSTNGVTTATTTGGAGGAETGTAGRGAGGGGGGFNTGNGGAGGSCTGGNNSTTTRGNGGNGGASGANGGNGGAGGDGVDVSTSNCNAGNGGTGGWGYTQGGNGGIGGDNSQTNGGLGAGAGGRGGDCSYGTGGTGGAGGASSGSAGGAGGAGGRGGDGRTGGIGGAGGNSAVSSNDAGDGGRGGDGRAGSAPFILLVNGNLTFTGTVNAHGGAGGDGGAGGIYSGAGSNSGSSGTGGDGGDGGDGADVIMMCLGTLTNSGTVNNLGGVAGIGGLPGGVGAGQGGFGGGKGSNGCKGKNGKLMVTKVKLMA